MFTELFFVKKGVKMKNDVTVLGYDLKDFYESLEEDKKELFFIIIAVGQSAEFARDYISCLRDDNMF